ncbi:MAG: tryptophan synthase subunit beta [Candidatus Limnocylindrales bacterium]
MTVLTRPNVPSRRARPRPGRPDVLAEIAARRAVDVAAELGSATFAGLARRARLAPQPRPAAEVLARPGLHLIAELKRRSPSAGTLTERESDLLTRARAYAAGGAVAISVLCEPHWFGGSLADLRAVRAAVAIPVLAKEFVVDARQLPLLRAAGADLVLLLAALHPARRLARLVEQALELGLEPLVEAHDARQLERSLVTRARLIGLNNRDLRTLALEAERAAGLLASVAGDRLTVAESGVRDAATLRDWRALGFDAALVGEAFMRARDPEAAVRAFVTAGSVPIDPGAQDRLPLVKICGLTDAAGALAAVRARADAVGLNLVPGTPRALSLEEAVGLARVVREAAAGSAGGRPRLVAVTADASAEQLGAIVAALDPDVLQLSGSEPREALARLDREVWKALHLPPVDPAPEDLRAQAGAIVAEARAYLGTPPCTRVLLDTAGGPHPGGTGRPIGRSLAAAIAREVPVILAGGLDPATVAAAVREVPAVGVDVASGVEIARVPGARTRKDPLRVALFVKRARAARVDRPELAARPSPVDAGLLEADAGGRWGLDREFGGRYVPETLVAALIELEEAWQALRHDPRFWAQLRELGERYVGRPSPLYRADRLAAELERRAGGATGRSGGGLQLWLKREDLDHTGAHKINNALGQALLTRRLGKSRVIAETGAGQHGVATATACALLDLPCVVYMGAEDIRRQAPNVLRMRVLGAEVREVRAGSATLKDAINEAMRDWVTNVASTHYVLGSAVGPHPYPTIVRDLQRIIGDEAAAQLGQVAGRLPDAAVACLGGGSNAIGLFSRFIGEPGVRLVGVEAAGEGLATGRHAAALTGGRPGVLHGSRSYLLQDADGQVQEAVSLSAGLDYPGIGPQLSALYAAGRLEVRAADDGAALDALRLLTMTEGIIPALETAHAIAALPDLLAGADGRPPLPPDALVLLGLSGRGDKDLGVLDGQAT